jgi:hypothetical protein
MSCSLHSHFYWHCSVAFPPPELYRLIVNNTQTEQVLI